MCPYKLLLAPVDRFSLNFVLVLCHWGHPTLHFIISNKEYPDGKGDARIAMSGEENKGALK
jgi:hypothetical protein